MRPFYIIAFVATTSLAGCVQDESDIFLDPATRVFGESDRFAGLDSLDPNDFEDYRSDLLGDDGGPAEVSLGEFSDFFTPQGFDHLVKGPKVELLEHEPEEFDWPKNEDGSPLIPNGRCLGEDAENQPCQVLATEPFLGDGAPVNGVCMASDDEVYACRVESIVPSCGKVADCFETSCDYQDVPLGGVFI